MIFCTLAGNVGKGGATIRQAGDTEVASFSVASTRKVKGEAITEWVDCSWFGTRGKAVAPFINQGDKITVVGELYTEEYNGKTKLRCRVSDVALQGGKRENDAPYGRSGAGASAKHTAPADDEDVPF